MADIGTRATLTIKRIVAQGAYLSTDNQDILLPRRFVTQDMSINDQVDVFICRDSEDRIIATTVTPKIMAGEFASLKVTQVNEVGAFADIGLDKELLIPFGQQKQPLTVGQTPMVYCLVNARDQRLIGSTKIDRWLKDQADDSITVGQQVDLICGPKTPLGTKVIVNHRYWGLVHGKAHYCFGRRASGTVANIRTDGKLDITLDQAPFLSDVDRVLQVLKDRSRQSKELVSEKASPEDIQQLFQMSKAAFKRAVGILYRQRQIQITEAGIKLAKDQQ